MGFPPAVVFAALHPLVFGRNHLCSCFRMNRSLEWLLPSRGLTAAWCYLPALAGAPLKFLHLNAAQTSNQQPWAPALLLFPFQEAQGGDLNCAFWWGGSGEGAWKWCCSWASSSALSWVSVCCCESWVRAASWGLPLPYGFILQEVC